MPFMPYGPGAQRICTVMYYPASLAVLGGKKQLLLVGLTLRLNPVGEGQQTNQAGD